MARTPTQTTAPAELMPADQQAEQQLVTLQDNAIVQHEAELNALAQRLNYQGSTHPDVLENSARDAIRRIGMGVFELGGYLLLLKKACGHGEFMDALGRLGVNQHSANKYLSVNIVLQLRRRRRIWKSWASPKWPNYSPWKTTAWKSY